MKNDQFNFAFLDDKPDRQQFLAEVRQSRQAVLDVIQRVPQAQWYEPRYHGWSLGAMIGHLNLADNLGLLQIKAGLVGIRFKVSMSGVDRLNGVTANLFQKRVVESSIKSMERNQQRIADFVMQLPVSKFSTQIYYPPLAQSVTVEQAIQLYFLFHWQHHLQTMHEVEGIQPPEHSDNV